MPETTETTAAGVRIWRSPYSRFGVFVEHPDDLEDETFTAEKAYTDPELKKIADMGFNGIWIHGQLHHIIPNPHFPEFAPNSEKHLAALHRLCERAARFGIKVYVYMQPPRAISVSETGFWMKHRDVAGQLIHAAGDDGREFDVQSLCTSLPYVRDYLRESFADFARLVPELGGFIIISASEYPAHCYCRRNVKQGPLRPRKLKMDFVPCDCPHCGRREPEDVVCELLQTIRDGVRSVSSSLKLIFWNWSWSMYLDPPFEEIISHLPKDILLLADFERGGYRRDGTYIDEYSLGYSGPSETYLAFRETAGRYGIPVIPKLQLGTTHELATVRSLPIYPSLFGKADHIRKTHTQGFLGCWNFGNLISTSVKAFNYFLDLKEDLSCNEALKRFANSEYPGKNADLIVSAWHDFSSAMERHPFCIPFLYDGPVNHTLALIPAPGRLSGKSVGRSWLPDERGDVYIEPAGFPDLMSRLKDLKDIWARGVEKLRTALGEDHKDFQNAAICGGAWASLYNMYRIYFLKKEWDDSKLDEFKRLCSVELDIVEKVLPWVAADPEQGWHIEGNFHSFDRELLEKKIAALRKLLA